jgi:hypothetical protein
MIGALPRIHVRDALFCLLLFLSAVMLMWRWLWMQLRLRLRLRLIRTHFSNAASKGCAEGSVLLVQSSPRRRQPLLIVNQQLSQLDLDGTHPFDLVVGNIQFTLQYSGFLSQPYVSYCARDSIRGLCWVWKSLVLYVSECCMCQTCARPPERYGKR